MASASDEFAQLSQQRLNLGAEQYGPFKFLELDTIEMAIEEVIDLSNYAFMTFVKLRILQAAIAQRAAEQTDEKGFVKMADFLKVQND